MTSKIAQGIDNLAPLIGGKFDLIIRYVLSLHNTNTARGHGFTELTFGGRHVSVLPGWNEEFIIIDPGTIRQDDVSHELWSFVGVNELPGFAQMLGRTLLAITVLCDEEADKVLVFSLTGDVEFYILLDEERDLTIVPGTFPREQQLYKVRFYR